LVEFYISINSFL